jgi:hypothetical protein
MNAKGSLQKQMKLHAFAAASLLSFAMTLHANGPCSCASALAQPADLAVDGIAGSRRLAAAQSRRPAR